MSQCMWEYLACNTHPIHANWLSFGIAVMDLELEVTSKVILLEWLYILLPVTVVPLCPQTTLRSFSNGDISIPWLHLFGVESGAAPKPEQPALCWHWSGATAQPSRYAVWVAIDLLEDPPTCDIRYAQTQPTAECRGSQWTRGKRPATEATG